MDYDGPPRLRVDYGRTSPDSRSPDRPDGPQLLVPVEDVGIDQQGNGRKDIGGFERSGTANLPVIGQPSLAMVWVKRTGQVDNRFHYVVLLHSKDPMAPPPKLSYTSAIVLQTIGAGYSYGFDIMEITGLPSGTVYPALRRLEQQELIRSKWEKQDAAFAEERPARKYYQLTRQGKDALAKARERFALLEQLAKDETSRRR